MEERWLWAIWVGWWKHGKSEKSNPHIPWNLMEDSIPQWLKRGVLGSIPHSENFHPHQLNVSKSKW